MKSKVLYIDNVTTEKYIKEYADKHKRNNNFSYVTFSEYNSKVGDIDHWHGDIFFNGEKYTYFNDVASSYFVTDGFDCIVGYVNNEGCIDFAKAGIQITYDNITSNRCEYFNTNGFPNGATYEFVSEINDYVNVSGGTWKIYADEGLTAVNGVIHGTASLNKSYEIILSYVFNVEGKECITYANVSVNNTGNVKSLNIIMPDTLAYGTIYTPDIEVQPKSAIQNVFHWESNSNNIEFINRQTGTFKCNMPGNVTITCTYTGNSSGVPKTFTINKVNPHLSLSAFNKTNISGGSTTCHAHYDTHGLSASAQWTNASGNATSATVQSSLQSKVVKFKLNDNYFYPNRAAIQFYGSTPKLTQNLYIQNVSADDINYAYNTVDFIVVAEAESSGEVDTNYIFESTGGLSNYTITNIVPNGTTTFTYVTAQITPNIIAELYSENTNDDEYLYYTEVTVSTTDKSFKKSEPTKIPIRK